MGDIDLTGGDAEDGTDTDTDTEFTHRDSPIPDDVDLTDGHRVCPSCRLLLVSAGYSPQQINRYTDRVLPGHSCDLCGRVRPPVARGNAKSPINWGRGP